MPNKKETTIEDLAVMVQKGFSGVDEKLEKIDGRFEKIDGRFVEVNKRFDSVEKGLNKLEYTVKSTFNSRIDKLEMDIDYIKNVLNIT